MKKRTGIIALLLLLVVLVVGGVELYKYNSMSFYLGMTKNSSGTVSYPMLTYGGVSRFGISKKAQKIGNEYAAECTNRVHKYVIGLMEEYEEFSLESTVRIVDGKTEVHMFGEGTKKGLDERTKIVQTVLLGQEYELGKSRNYCYLFSK